MSASSRWVKSEKWKDEWLERDTVVIERCVAAFDPWTSEGLFEQSRKRPIPEELKDVYDEERYQKWQAYTADKTKVKLIFSIIAFVSMFAVIITDALSFIVKSITNQYLSTLVILGIYIALTMIIEVISDYVLKIKIKLYVIKNVIFKKIFIW